MTWVPAAIHDRPTRKTQSTALFRTVRFVLCPVLLLAFCGAISAQENPRWRNRGQAKVRSAAGTTADQKSAKVRSVAATEEDQVPLPKPPVISSPGAAPRPSSASLKPAAASEPAGQAAGTGSPADVAAARDPNADIRRMQEEKRRIYEQIRRQLQLLKERDERQNANRHAPAMGGADGPSHPVSSSPHSDSSEQAHTQNSAEDANAAKHHSNQRAAHGPETGAVDPRTADTHASDGHAAAGDLHSGHSPDPVADHSGDGTGNFGSDHPEPGEHSVVEGPIDRMALANNLYAAGQLGLALEMYQQIDQKTLDQQDRFWIEYQMASCLRKLRRSDDAKSVYRRLVAQPDAGLLSDMARWWLDRMTDRAALESELQRLQQSIDAMKEVAGGTTKSP